MAQLFNNIFWQNHDQTTARIGAGIFATATNKLIARNNLFSGNGMDSPTESRFAGFNVGNGFLSANIGTVPTNASLGNYAGDPAFVSPRDPRPGGDGPAAFFIDANFNLTVNSAAIDGGNDAVAPGRDFLGRTRVDIPGKGFAGAGPKSDVGAFEFQGTGGIAVGGAFRVVTTSVAPGGAVQANGTTFTEGPNSIVVAFSGPVDRNSVTPNDLVISGSGLNGTKPVQPDLDRRADGPLQPHRGLQDQRNREHLHPARGGQEPDRSREPWVRRLLQGEHPASPGGDDSDANPKRRTRWSLPCPPARW